MRSVRTAVSLLALAVSPVAFAAPCAGFTDVDSTDPFCTQVAWVKNRGITLGCTSATLYCPNAAVTRLQMALFMYRQGNVTVQLGGNTAGGTARLGTTDFQPVEIIANNLRALRIEPNPGSPNVIAGNAANSVFGGSYAATVGGGGATSGNVGSYLCPAAACANMVTDTAGTVGGGVSNHAGNDDADPSSAMFATVGGGYANRATGFISVIAGGYVNRANGPGGTVSGGEFNIADGGNSTVAGGFTNRAAGNASFVAGGSRNRALGIGSLAGGIFAQADNDGCFVFADRSSSNSATSCFAPNEIVVRGLGGFYLWTAGNADSNYSGATLAPGTGAWAALSDVHGKHAIDPVDAREVLEKVAAMPISTWQWKAEPGTVRHMGPMAQDFHSAFGLGNSDTQIVTIDADGVALAAIQGLNAKLEAERGAKDAEIAALRAELVAIRSVLATIAATQSTQPAEIAR